MTRVYVPVTLTGLTRLQQKGELEADAGGDGRIGGHAVTPAVREWYVEGDVEELEFSAMIDAAESALGLLAHEADRPDHPGTAHRRVVLALDVPDAGVIPGQGSRSAVRIAGPLTLSQVVSVHLDEPESEPVIAAATAAYAAARAGDDDAQFLLDEAEACDLLWYDVTEIDDLVG